MIYFFIILIIYYKFSGDKIHLAAIWAINGWLELIDWLIAKGALDK